MSSLEEKKAQIEKQKETWLKGRLAELERTRAQDLIQRTQEQDDNLEINKNNQNINKVIENITVQITDRIRKEIETELKEKYNREYFQKQALAEKTESFLASEIENQTCAICFELMEPPDRTPMILFPCGHSFCNTCLKAQQRYHYGKDKCPQCRSPITSQAKNVSLQQIIQSFTSKQRLITKEQKNQNNSFKTLNNNENSHSASSPNIHSSGSYTDSELENNNDPFEYILYNAPKDKREDAEQYLRKYKMYNIRCRVMSNELSDTKQEVNQLQRNIDSYFKVSQVLEQEEDQLNQQLKDLMQELELVNRKRAENNSKVQEFQNRLDQFTKKQNVLKTTVDSLVSKRDKCKVILENLVPGLNISEFNL